MKIKDIKTYLNQQDMLPSSDEERKTWFSCTDALAFLRDTSEGMVPVYASYGGLFAYGLIVSEDKLHSDYIKDLLGWNFCVSGGYGYGTSNIEGKTERCLFDPMDWSGTEILNGSMPIFFLRGFEGHDPHNFLEINQKISHVLGIFWLDDRKALCRINKIGDYEDIATMDQEGGGILCAVRREDLDYYLFLSKSVLIRVFDVSRSLDWMKSSSNDNRKEEFFKDDIEEIYAKRITVFDAKQEAETAWLRGFQIIRNKKSEVEMLQKLHGEEVREYASFIIWDWKNKKICECSSDPKAQGNYFVESDLPFQTSPAFFRAEVLAKYKQDPLKYTIEERKIICRASWSLQYDINAEGQVHAYICDLAHLPYVEQLYWKSFNEEPRAGLSERAVKTDFKAEWDLEYNPLLSLKQILDSFPTVKSNGATFCIWKLPPSPKTRDINFLNYVVTDSFKEWEDQILALAQIIVDGLCIKSINKFAEQLKCRDSKLGSLKQLSRCLEVVGVSEEEIAIFSKPLLELWDLRSSIVAHPGGSHPKCDLKVHYRTLLERCDKAMRKLADFVKQGILDIK